MSEVATYTLTCDGCGTVAAGEPGVDGPRGWISLRGERRGTVGSAVYLQQVDVCPACVKAICDAVPGLLSVKR